MTLVCIGTLGTLAAPRPAAAQIPTEQVQIRNSPDVRGSLRV